MGKLFIKQTVHEFECCFAAAFFFLAVEHERTVRQAAQDTALARSVGEQSAADIDHCFAVFFADCVVSFDTVDGIIFLYSASFFYFSAVLLSGKAVERCSPSEPTTIVPFISVRSYGILYFSSFSIVSLCG